MRYFLYALTGMYLVFAALQLNDPDPLLWVPLYLLPAGITLAAARGGRWRALSWGLAVAYVALAVWWWPARFDGLTGAMKPGTTVEEGRESLGLFIAAVGMAISGYVAGVARRELV